MMKTVGRRGSKTAAISESAALQRTVAQLRPVAALVPRGVYRFTTFEEADRWMITKMATILARRKSKTSSESVAP